MQLTGLHHVTAVTANAPANLAFYTKTLGMRLVKKTVNQDDVSAYHLFYGDELGNAGTEVTFFDWAAATPHQSGPGSISAIGLRVTGRPALQWWAQRLSEAGVAHEGIVEYGGLVTLAFTDGEGQHLRLVDDSSAALPGGNPWGKSPVLTENGIRGLASATLTVTRLEPTARVLTDVMNMRLDRTYDRDGQEVHVFAMGLGGPGAEVEVEEQPSARSHRQVGAGGVHHLAFRTPNPDEQAAWLARIHDAGLNASDIVDRFYFQSLYFREPGGILFEIATDGPGFATDEDPAHLGERLALPPFLESRRAQIEAGLKPLNTSETP